MNKVFKVIWSEARNAYVVVSEIAKNHGSKSCSTKKLLAMLIATGVMTCASVAPAMAANLAPTETKIEIGEDASASGEGSVAIGQKAVASNLVAIAIGRDAVASGVDSIAIGSDTKATQTFSVAVGNDIGFTAYAGTAVGQQAYASGDNATAIGTMTNIDTKYNASHDDWRKAGAQSTAIGAYAGSWGVASTAVGGFSKAEGKLATAIGYNSQANVDYGTALGDYSEVKAGWGVAIGASSFADRESHVVGLYAPDEDKDSLTWKANAGAVSVGSSVEGQEITRQITNVAAGSADTDAVNVAQLNAVKAAAGKKVSLVDGENTKATLVKDDATGTQYKVDVDLSKYAKTEDVAVVYDKNKTSLRSTNASVAENAIALGKDASAVKDGGVALGNEAHAGNKGTSLGTKAKSGREGATVVGYNTNSSGLYSTVVGTDAVINTDGTAYQTPVKDVIVQGAAATVVGSKNTVDNQNNKVYSGVANNIMGAANTIKSSNGITIQGSGNTVTDAYKDMDIDLWGDGFAILGGDYSVLAKKQSGAIAVVGGANTVSKQTDSTVIGYDNRLIGDEKKGSHDVFMAGSHNKLNNVSDSIVMGNENAITDVSNVISFGHQNTISADNAVAIGNGADVSVEGGVALGVGSVADRAAGKVVGYDPATGAEYVIPEDDAASYVWKATKGAVSVGSARETRQITNVAAGTEDTDAVNVAQLKKVSEAAANANKGWKLKTKNGNASDVKPGATVEFDGDANIQVGNDGNKVSVTLKKQLTGIQSIIGAGEGAGSISFADGGIKINNKVTINKDGKITGVAAGAITENSTDAVNGSQLHAVATEAGKHTQVKAGTNVGIVPDKTEDGTHVYTVNADGTTVSGDSNVAVTAGKKDANNVTNYGVKLNKDLKGIESISNGDAKLTLGGFTTELTNGKGAAITLFGDTTTINNKVTVYKDGRIAGVAAGINDKDAVN
ncbi:ESPR-type extended signal peptide-containing protein, partial [Megasphaera elsdenii]|uniref:ESPR-type extended signal peptide-containing protein n=1 Tax=Megasphaera elsdenii TaxID=907 RepID=UPI002A80E6FD